MKYRGVALVALVLLLVPVAADAGKGGGGRRAPAPSCTAHYYCDSSNRYYQNSSCNNSYVESCANGCSNGACVANAPTCAISIDDGTIPYGGSTTLHWSSTDATQITITNIGPVTGSGATHISAAGTYTGTATGAGGTAACTAGANGAKLTVTPPALPSATISSSLGSVVQIGQSSTILATFSTGTGDALTHDNIDSPEGTGVGADTNPDTSRPYTFSPTQPGTYIFYARATTQYYSSWVSYASVTITVPPVPACVLGIAPTTIAQGQSATLSWSSTNATGGTISGVGSVGPSGSTSVAPSQATTYTGTFTGPGGSAACTNTVGSGSGGGSGGSGGDAEGGVTLSVSCTPAYSCSGNAIRYTDTQCNISNVASCIAPAYCSPGSASCVYPPPSFTTDVGGSGLTGHLQVLPSIVPQGLTTKVYWNVNNVQSCTVQGANGDLWTGASSGSGGKVTLAIIQPTVYTLACTGLDQSALSESQTLNILPIFNER